MSDLPIAQLESLKFKATQIIESINALTRTVEANNLAMMPAWPDILSKYNILLSQTHNFSSSILQTNSRSGNPFERIALHPSAGLTDAQLDNDLIPLLRNQQTTDVLRMENDSVRRLAEHMSTRGSLAALSDASKADYPAVLAELDAIRAAHDSRAERAIRAVTMLRDRFEWKQRVEVEVAEPEELEWDPRVEKGVPMEEVDGDESEEDAVEEELGAGDPEVGTPMQT